MSGRRRHHVGVLVSVGDSNRHSDAVAVISEVILVLTLLAIGPRLGDDKLLGIRLSSRSSGVRRVHKRVALSVEVRHNLGLLEIARVAEELEAVNVTTHRQSGGSSRVDKDYFADHCDGVTVS